MFFVKIYRYFNAHKPLLYTLLIISTIVFVVFGCKLRFQEDLSSLLPKSNSSNAGLVFGNIKVKDKVFIQLTGESPEILAECVDELMDSVLRDNTDIANSLYRIDADVMLGALDFAMEHVPSFVDTGAYRLIDSAIANAGETMQANHDLIMSDETGVVTQMVATDPLNLRRLLLPDRADAFGFTIYNDHIFSRDTTVALIFLSPNFQSFNSAAGNRFMHRLEGTVDEFRDAHPNVEVLMHGAPVRSGGNSKIMKRDIFITMSISLILILLVLCISFKSFRVVWQTVMPVAYGMFFALACMYWLKGEMSLMSMGIGTVVIGVAISYCLHVIIHQNFVCDVEQMLHDESVPVCLGCLTTVGAFLGLLFTKSELLQDFGIFATFALVGSTLFSLIFLPHFLKNVESDRNAKVFNIVKSVNNYRYDRNPVLISVLAVIILMGFIFSPKVQFDNNLKHIGYESKQLLKSEELYSKLNIDGNIQRYYAVIASDLDEALDANNELSQKLLGLKEKGDITAYVPTVAMLFQSETEQEERIARWSEYWSDEKIDEAMRAVRRAAVDNDVSPDIFDPFKAMVEADYAVGDLYSSGVVPEGLLCNFVEKYDDKYLIFNSVQIKPENKAKVDESVVGLSHAVVVDPFYYTGNMITLIRDDFSTTLLISSIFVFVVLLLSFRKIMVSIIAFLPMFLSWYVVQGWMAIFGLPFNLINIVISTFIFGIGVDYSIFVMQGLLADADNHDSRLLEYHKYAVFFSAIVLLIVIVSMMCAIHPAIKSIGLCTLIGMASTIMITYTLQPLLFNLWRRYSVRK